MSYSGVDSHVTGIVISATITELVVTAVRTVAVRLSGRCRSSIAVPVGNVCSVVSGASNEIISPPE